MLGSCSDRPETKLVKRVREDGGRGERRVTWRWVFISISIRLTNDIIANPRQ